jgi:hypothetical protein
MPTRLHNGEGRADGAAIDKRNAFEDGEDRVIGDEPGNTAQDQDLSEEALSQGEGRA